MKAQMLSKEKMDHLFNHILDGFKSSAQGLLFLKRDRLISDQEYTDLLEKNAQRVIERIEEFKISNRLMSVFFACLFLYMQVSDEGLDMRRSRRTRSRRRNETEQVEL
jgi:hypothetical protein